MKAAKAPKFDFKGANTSPEMFMKTAEVLENTGVHAYSGQALNIKTPAYVKAAVSILTIEARHATVIGLLNEGAAPRVRKSLPTGRSTRRTAAAVLTAVKGTGIHRTRVVAVSARPVADASAHGCGGVVPPCGASRRRRHAVPLSSQRCSFTMFQRCDPFGPTSE